MNVEIYDKFPRKYNLDIDKIVDEITKKIVFEENESPEEYKNRLLSEIKNKPVAIATWHKYIAGLLSFEVKGNLIYVGTILIEFKETDIANTIKEALRKKYNNYNIMYCNIYAGNECFLPLLKN